VAGEAAGSHGEPNVERLDEALQAGAEGSLPSISFRSLLTSLENQILQRSPYFYCKLPIVIKGSIISTF
jgi:hypothetical protein